MFGLLTLSLAISHLVQADFPTGPCWLEGEACNIEPGNLLSSLSEVPEVATCRQLWQDNTDCHLFWTGEFPPQGVLYAVQLLHQLSPLHGLPDRGVLLSSQPL